ncbi:hypothetical protein REY82_004546 [Klebsiella pneumoniae]|uniref:Uncharacterized protein n=1 Tax=Klebsiella pneumoniae TaxID=573 RepID=A0A486VRN1_KLEPN|nr:hypothetical protein [Klebsiella pneumoniae]EKZ5871270.1 hypothetical protein [Klebsiella pneumoniae]MBD0003261.1 hypothetical protein [Klebsiella pneumoniae]MDK8038530.1 hypothetical protein [Klebsiella pneumoniae]VGM53144.1 Uncharacterised protein [Klebsiella pneumoniae]HBR6949637.1 hypothetical protein [Klebsiella pneumoniae]
MSIKSIKLESGISDPEFMQINTDARISERDQLLGLLRIYMGLLKKENLTLEEIYSSVERWIVNRELTNNEGNKQ